ncbi:chorismate-binding protein [Muriicola soli]|uniref:isochorismate synthase n=1 Tax=Muriicola soli TaxID=2507538 RepID=A0A411E9D3_9FLAO|nr:chorismate-binding protein [Muriicola soli]QBA64321.1 isochorismate synthase [Muriicola soli]
MPSPKNKIQDELLAQLEAHHQNHLPFVIFKYPGASELKAILQSDASLNFTSNFTEPGFVFSPFDDGQRTILLRPDDVLIAKLHNTELPKESSLRQHIEDQKEASRYKKLVADAITAIQQHDLRKVVLSRPIEVATANSAINIFNQLSREYPTAFCYCWYHPKVGCWVGATPEILLKVQGAQFTTVALAGTIEKSGTEKPNWQAKEREEQQLVTQYILEVAADLGIEVNSSEAQTTDAGALWHLKTTLSGKVQPEQIASMIRSLHPTPAVCGIPLKESMYYIEQHEGYPRKFYTGYLGEIKEGSQREIQLFVNLRCMEYREGKAIVYVGGGITRDSDPEKEWQETIAKSRTILKVL